MKCFFSVFFSFSFIFLAVFGINCFYGYMFPLKYQEEIASASESFDIDAAIINSIINIESHFKKNAVSQKGATGLMQVMPSTATAVADQIALDDFDLKDPEDNISIGTCYFSQMLDRFQNLETALAAYNAGPTNVTNWLKSEKYSEDGTTLKDIPFEETKNYIAKFRVNYSYYKTKK